MGRLKWKSMLEPKGVGQEVPSEPTCANLGAQVYLADQEGPQPQRRQCRMAFRYASVVDLITAGPHAEPGKPAFHRAAARDDAELSG
jgi:hypothetical protein